MTAAVAFLGPLLVKDDGLLPLRGLFRAQLSARRQLVMVFRLLLILLGDRRRAVRADVEAEQALRVVVSAQAGADEL